MVRRSLAYPCVLLLLAAFQSHSWAQQKYEGMLIRIIRFDPVQQPLDPSELHDILPLQMNQPLRMSDIRASIDRLFATGRYADIVVDAQPYRDGVAITFTTKPAWFIGGVSVSGKVSSPPNVGQLENASDLNLGQPYNDDKLKQGLADQQRLLETNGLFQSKINPVFDWETTRDYQQVNIHFDIDSGPRAHFTTPVLTGDLKMAPEKIFNATKFRRWLVHTWKPMTQTRVRQGLEGVRSLYEKEGRLEAKVTLEAMRFLPETRSAQPTLQVEAGPRIEVNTIGASVSRKNLRRYVPIYEEHAVDHDLLVEGARNLRDYFQSNGYFEAEVEFKQQRVVNDRASIDYLINTGKRHKLVYIEIQGNKYFTTPSIRERMYLQTANFLQFRHGRYSEILLTRDKEAIVNLYESNGFRDVRVTHRTEDDYKGTVGDIAVFIQIEEGPQYFVNDLRLEGVTKMKESELLSRLSSAAGQPFSEFNVAVDRDTILARYFEDGFPNVTFEWSYKPTAQPNRVDLRFVVHEGEQQFVRQVLVTGAKTTSTRIIDHALRLNPGDPLSPTAITETQRRLYDVGVFARVDAAIQDPDGETETKYVLYQLDEARRFSIATGFGAEFGRIGGCQTCFEAPAGATGFSPRVSFDITRNNLWGVAHSISLRTRASTLDQRALLTYSWPRFTGNDKLLVSFTTLFENSRDVRTFSFQRAEVSAQLTQRLTKATTLFYRYAYRRVSVFDLKVTPFLLSTLSQPVRVGITSLNVVQDRRDDPTDPHKGVYNTLDLGLAAHPLGSEVNYTRFLARNASYYGIGKHVVFARSTQFGNLRAFHYTGDPLAAIPLAERFFGGGGTSHRGFGENQAGPRDIATGFPLGGTVVLFNQTELRFPLIGDNIGGVLFHDMGNIYSSIGNFSFRVNQDGIKDFDYMVHAVGFGLRYRLPIGPVRLDLGYSLNPPSFFGFNGTQADLLRGGVNPCDPMSPVANQCVVHSVGHFQFSFSIGQTF